MSKVGPFLFPDRNLERGAKAFANATRLVFGGAAGGIGYRIVSTGESVALEIALFIILIAATGVLEYGLLFIEEQSKEGK